MSNFNIFLFPLLVLEITKKQTCNVNKQIEYGNDNISFFCLNQYAVL